MSRVKIVVDSRVRLPADLPERVVADLREEFSHKNPEWSKKRAMGYATYDEPRLIVTFNQAGEQYTCPRGGMGQVRDVLRKHGLSWEVEDRRVSLPQTTFPAHRVSLWDHQDDAVGQMIRYENCLIKSPTGSGKTTSAIALIARVSQPSIVVVWNAGLLKQWVERIESELGIPRSEIGLVQGSRTQVRKITIAMQQTLARMPSDRARLVHKSFGVLVCDEVQRFAARTFMSVVDKFPARYRIGISADETRKDRKEFLIYDMFGRVASEVSQRELIEKGLIHGIEVRIIPTEFRAPWYVRQRDDDSNPDYNRLLAEMTTDADRNALLLDVVEREADAGAKILIFSHRVEHCRELDSALTGMGRSPGLLLGGADWAEVFGETVAAIKSGRKSIGIGTVQAIGQGIDLPGVDRGVVTTPLSNNRQLWGQVRGRMCRRARGKTDAVVYYLWDQHVFGMGPVENMAKWNESALVCVGDRWVQAKQFLDEKRKEKRDAASSEGTDWIFE